MTNLIIVMLALTLVLFIVSILSSHSNNSDFNHSLETLDLVTIANSPSVNPPARLRARPDRFNVASNNLNSNNKNDSSDEDQIDDPESARASSAATYREGVLGNYELFLDTTLSRPGDNGSKFDIDKVDGIDLSRVEDLKREYGINMIASDHIPMDRVVPDIRHPECKYWHYPDKLPTTSVVIVFHNEGLTTLMRTAHSVLLRSPRKLIREVLLIDDCSDKKNLGKELEDYILEHFGDFKSGDMPTYQGDKGNLGETLYEKSGKVRLLRNVERQGLIRSRTRGAEAATGDVVVFLDAHCEVNQNWLPPLLAPVANNRKTLTVPIIDGIDSENFEYRPVYARKDEHFRGIWEWGMLYKEIGLDMNEHMKTHRISEPYDSPTHAGGLFAIDRQFFAELGYYDPGLLVWGGENFELSFKVWQCGGKLQWVPCSRVGHIYRPFMPYSFGTMANKRKGPLVLTNYKRVIEVWFDDAYKEYFYTREPLARFYDPGDITKQLELKKKLGCKSFDWFMTNVASDVFRDFPKLPKNLEWGEVRLKNTDTCLDTQGSQPPQRVILSGCHSFGGNQLFRLNAAGQMGVGERCVDATSTKMFLTYCKLGHVDGPWRIKDNFLIHKQRNLCLTYDKRVYLDKCNFDTRPDNQQWIWKKIRPTVYDE
jgi:polypeptide N-acetylgalactosaminyltransferase